MRSRGIDPARLAEGTGCSLAQLTEPRGRVSWDAFARFMTNLGELLDDDQLVELGGSALEAPLLRALLLPGRLLFGASEIYRWAFGPTGPANQLFATHDGRVDEVAPGVLRFETRMKQGYLPSRENYLLMRGTLAALSRALGLAAATVTQIEIEGGMIFDIRVPEERGAVGFLRRRLSWVRAARSTAEELERAHTELNERYLDLQREVERRIGVEAELRRLNDELERRVAERTAALESFSYSVSHDLRSPLRGISGFCQALLDDYDAQLDERARGYLRRIRAGTIRMGEIIDGLLQLSRVSRAELKYETTDLTELARLVVAELVRTDPERDVDWVIPRGMSVQGDPRLLRILLENLLSNAWKFTHQAGGARIEIGHEQAVFRIRDNGAGFDMRHASRLFQPFERLHTGTTYPGTGIGLATVRRIVERHGGRIWAEGVVGGGATFFFTLSA